MIKVKNIKKKFKQQIAVDDISFSVNEGENFVLLGTSGCGKTTTFKMINRLIEPSSGKFLSIGIMYWTNSGNIAQKYWLCITKQRIVSALYRCRKHCYCTPAF